MVLTGLADALSRSLMVSDPRVVQSRVLTLNVSSGVVVIPATWRKHVGDLTGTELYCPHRG